MALQNKKCLCVVSAISDYHYVKAAGVPAVVVCMFWVRAEVYGTEDQLTASQLCDLHSTHTNSSYWIQLPRVWRPTQHTTGHFRDDLPSLYLDWCKTPTK